MMHTAQTDDGPSLTRDKAYGQPSVFRPEHLLAEARRQKSLDDAKVPAVCVLDPDGDLFRLARASGQSRSPGWACFHTEMYELALPSGTRIGIIGNAVGAPFAVLVAEQLFVSGCRFLISITSSGRIAVLERPPYLVLIDRAWRDEGTSLHYLPASAGDFVAAPDTTLVDRIDAGIQAAFPPGCGTPVYRGATWTTDAPYRETETAIAAARARGIFAVEMEAAALYAFATVRRVDVICFAHVTNTMGEHGRDFDKGEADGTVTSLRLIGAATAAWLARHDVTG